jgi:CIC family chloride channel protein
MSSADEIPSVPRVDRPRAWIANSRVAITQWFRRLVPTERQRLFIITVLVGGACGLSAVAFHLAIDLVTRIAIERAEGRHGIGGMIALVLVPTFGAIMAGLALQYIVPNARGSGVPQMKIAYVQEGGRIRFRDALGKFVVSAVQLGTGSSLGREGPTVQICGGVASLLGRAARIPQPSLRRLLPVGAAAGIAAAFNAPIAAVTFTIEEIVGALDQTLLSGVIVAAALAAVVERSVLGGEPVFIIRQAHRLEGPASLLLYASLGLLAAGFSITFTDGLLRLRARMRAVSSLPKWVVPGLGGLATGVLALVASAALHQSGITGGGYRTLAAALAGAVPVRAMIVLCLLKLVATVFAYSTGGAGGIFAPSLFIGGMLGGAVGALDTVLFHHPPSSIGAFALVGMGAVFAGIIRAPITSVLIIMEMTDGYSLVLPLMIANMSAYALARHFRPVPIYEALLAQDGIDLHPQRPAAKSPDAGAIPKIVVEPGDFVAFTPGASAPELLDRGMQPDRQAVFPVIDGGRLVGLVTPADIAFIASEPDVRDALVAADLMRAPAWLTADDDLKTAFEKMRANSIHALPVVDAEGHVVSVLDEVSIAHELIRART